MSQASIGQLGPERWTKLPEILQEFNDRGPIPLNSTLFIFYTGTR